MGIRAFIAAELTEEVRDELGRVQKRLAGRGVKARWVRPEAMHLTLKFLGDVGPEAFEALCEALRAPVACGAPLALELAGVGAFPSERRPRVIWVGLAGDTRGLGLAAAVLEARLEPLGFPREARAFAPHLTLGRIPPDRGGTDRPGGLEGASGERYAGPAFRVGELVLFESRLRREGPLYTPRQRVSLT